MQIINPFPPIFCLGYSWFSAMPYGTQSVSAGSRLLLHEILVLEQSSPQDDGNS